MNHKIYFNTQTMTRFNRRLHTTGGLMQDAEIALMKADKSQQPLEHINHEKNAVKSLEEAKAELLAIVADIETALEKANEGF